MGEGINVNLPEKEPRLVSGKVNNLGSDAERNELNARFVGAAGREAGRRRGGVGGTDSSKSRYTTSNSPELRQKASNC